MTSIADSNAFFDKDRLLAQHQAALTILQGMLSDPNCSTVSWLDLACGRGQIIAHLNNNLSTTERAKINLLGYDIENTYSRHAKKIAESMGLGAYAFEIGTLSRFWENHTTNGPWRFITLTNTTHEIEPVSLAEVIIRCIERLDVEGCLFLYDMEKLPAEELGAIPWSASEIKAILSCICKVLGCSQYEPAVGTWAHKSCNGWNAQIRRAHMILPKDFHRRLNDAIQATTGKVLELLQTRLVRINATLCSLAENGPETEEEEKEKETLLYQFWAISQVLGGKL